MFKCMKFHFCPTDLSTTSLRVDALLEVVVSAMSVTISSQIITVQGSEQQ